MIHQAMTAEAYLPFDDKNGVASGAFTAGTGE
jgi:hypothetical protein